MIKKPPPVQVLSIWIPIRIPTIILIKGTGLLIRGLGYNSANSEAAAIAATTATAATTAATSNTTILGFRV